MSKIAHTLVLLALAGGAFACSGPPCRNARDCPQGTYCAISGASIGSGGVCRLDCETADDCLPPTDSSQRAVCTNEGRCRNDPIPPRLTIFEPEPGMVLAPGTSRIRLTGELETAAESVLVEVAVNNELSCAGGSVITAEIENPEPGQPRVIPFVIDDVRVGPLANSLAVEARIGRSLRRRRVEVSVSCPDCPTIDFSSATRPTAAGGQAVLRGQITPAVPAALWRVHSSQGDVFDGPIDLSGAGFAVDSVPLFARGNRVEIITSGPGGQLVCAKEVVSPDADTSGLRAVALWDGQESDLDLHLVGPSGRYGDPMTSLSPRSPAPFFAGNVHDDQDGSGPEQLRLREPPDGVYGVVLEPVYDGADPGSNARAWVLADGSAIHRGPLGPRYLTSFAAELWIIGVIRVEDGSASWELIDEVVPAATPPTTAPSAWPVFY